jgi:class 3 adenylate cyclase
MTDQVQSSAGTTTLLFTDIEGSTKLLQQLGNRYAVALADHHRLLREAFANHGGVELDSAGGRPVLQVSECSIRSCGGRRRPARADRSRVARRASRFACGWACTRANRSCQR